MRRILFITATRIGDCVLSTGVYDRLAALWPQARITVGCGPLAAPVFRAAPGCERIVVMTKTPIGGHWATLWRAAIAVRWDLIVDLRGSATAWVLRARERSVFRGELSEPVHKVVELARVLDFDPPPAPRFWLDDRARRDAAALLGDDPRPLLAVAPAAAVPMKAWPAERWAELADALTRPGAALSGARVAVLGGAQDAAAAAALLSRLGPERALDAVGRLDLPGAAALVAQARLFVGADSGMSHIAAAVGAPTLALFGATDERRYAPFGAHARAIRGTPFTAPIQREAQKGRAAWEMETISVEQAYAAAAALLEDTAAGAERARA